MGQQEVYQMETGCVQWNRFGVFGLPVQIPGFPLGFRMGDLLQAQDFLGSFGMARVCDPKIRRTVDDRLKAGGG